MEKFCSNPGLHTHVIYQKISHSLINFESKTLEKENDLKGKFSSGQINIHFSKKKQI